MTNVEFENWLRNNVKCQVAEGGLSIHALIGSLEIVKQEYIDLWKSDREKPETNHPPKE